MDSSEPWLLLRLGYWCWGTTIWTYVYPPCCPRGHEWTVDGMRIELRGPFHTLNCPTCGQDDPLGRWWVLYPHWSNAEQRFVYDDLDAAVDAAERHYLTGPQSPAGMLAGRGGQYRGRTRGYG